MQIDHLDAQSRLFYRWKLTVISRKHHQKASSAFLIINQQYASHCKFKSCRNYNVEQVCRSTHREMMNDLTRIEVSRWCCNTKCNAALLELLHNWIQLWTFENVTHYFQHHTKFDVEVLITCSHHESWHVDVRLASASLEKIN